MLVEVGRFLLVLVFEMLVHLCLSLTHSRTQTHTEEHILPSSVPLTLKYLMIVLPFFLFLFVFFFFLVGRGGMLEIVKMKNMWIGAYAYEKCTYMLN